MKNLFSVVGVLLFYNFSFSHEHWINLENFYPSIGEKIKVYACSGHSFPKSDEILSERVFNGFKVITPDNKEKFFETKSDKKSKTRSAQVLFEKEGTYVILFYLQKPPSKSPVYMAKALVTVGKGKKPEKILESELEIVPEKEISQLKTGDELPIRILHGKKPISLTVAVSIEGKKNFFLKTNKDGQLSLKIKLPGRYLITTNHKGFGSSLTFFIREEKKK